MVIRLNNLNYRLDHKAILTNINLEIKAGEKVIIIGANGSGKSTLLKIIGKSIAARNVTNTFTKIFYMADKYYMPKNYYARDFLYQMMQIFKTSFAIDYYLEFLEIPNLPIGKLSKGNHQKVAILLCVISNADLILCDEVLDGLDGKMIKKIISILHKTPKTIILVTHYKTLFSRSKFKIWELEKGVLVSAN